MFFMFSWRNKKKIYVHFAVLYCMTVNWLDMTLIVVTGRLNSKPTIQLYDSASFTDFSI